LTLLLLHQKLAVQCGQGTSPQVTHSAWPITTARSELFCPTNTHKSTFKHTHSHSHKHTLTHTHTHTHTQTPSHSLTHTHTHTLTLSHSYSLTHTHMQTSRAAEW